MRKLSDLRKSVAYHAASAKADFVDEVHALMKQRGIRQKDLAASMGVPASQISRMLSGDQNVTLDTMVQVAAALDRTLRVHLAKRGVVVQWHDFPPVQQDAQQTGSVDVGHLAGSERLQLSAASSG